MIFCHIPTLICYCSSCLYSQVWLYIYIYIYVCVCASYFNVAPSSYPHWCSWACSANRRPPVENIFKTKSSKFSSISPGLLCHEEVEIPPSADIPPCLFLESIGCSSFFMFINVTEMSFYERPKIS